MAHAFFQHVGEIIRGEPKMPRILRRTAEEWRLCDETTQPSLRDGHLWLEQNRAKASKWAKLARNGHDIAWEFEKPGGGYTARMLIDGEI
jgi:hypothetical protein